MFWELAPLQIGMFSGYQQNTYTQLSEDADDVETGTLFCAWASKWLYMHYTC